MGKRFYLFIVILLLFCGTLSGCAQDTLVDAEPAMRKMEFDYPDLITLRLVMDDGTVGFEAQVHSLIEEFEKTYENVTIEVEFLPNPAVDDTWKIRRNKTINEIRKQIEHGNGPDIFLINGFSSVEQLFPDANESMRTGCFADLNECYQEDAGLNEDGLVASVMDAGVVNGARYILPLRYNLGTIYAVPDRLQRAGLSTSVFDSGITGLLDAVTRLGDADVANCLSGYAATMHLLNYFSDVIDYDARNVTLPKEELVAFLQSCQDFQAAFPNLESLSNLSDTVSFCSGDSWLVRGDCMITANATGAMEEAAAAMALGEELLMISRPSSSGETVATVSYYAAVSANCAYPDVAYEFLRLFLMEETQWEQNVDPEKLTGTDSATFNRSGRSLYGCPVLRDGAVLAMYPLYREKTMNAAASALAGGEEIDPDAFEKRRLALSDVKLDDLDVPIYWAEPDDVRFSVYELSSELGAIVRSLNDPETGQPTDVDIEALAEEYIDFLYAYLHGGTETE